MHAVTDEQPQRRPVPTDDLEVAFGAPRHRVPRVQADRLGARATFVLERDPATRGAIAHPREDVDDGAVAVQAGQFRVPRRPVAVHVLEQSPVLVAAQALLDLAAVALGVLRRPLRREAGMHHHPAQRAVDVHQLLQAQPAEQYVAVRGEHHALQVGVDLALLLLAALADRQQRQVVVAQHQHAAGAQRMHQPQRFQRLPTAIDQVAAEPQRVLRRIEGDAFQQALGGVVTALQVADRPDTHARIAISACEKNERRGETVAEHLRQGAPRENWASLAGQMTPIFMGCNAAACVRRRSQ